MTYGARTVVKVPSTFKVKVEVVDISPAAILFVPWPGH